MRHVPVLTLLLATLASGAGCGRERLEPPDVERPAAPLGTAVDHFPEAGLIVQRPGNWPLVRGRSPLVASAASGTATVALWRYRRSEPLPREDAALDAAQKALEQAARARDGDFALDRARRVEVDGAPGIQLLGTEKVAGRERRVRSTHVYAKEAEFVVDAYAEPADFARVDKEVFRPLVRTLRIEPPTS